MIDSIALPTPNKRPSPLSGLDYHTNHGHVVRSRAEAMICDWLHHNQISHICEMRVTIDGCDYYPDFYLPGKNLWVEFVEPMAMNPDKAEHDEAKRLLYERAGMNVVWLDDDDIRNVGAAMIPRLDSLPSRAFAHTVGPFVYSDIENLSKLRHSAEQGIVGAQNNLGVLYYEGKSVPKDAAEAAKWWALAAAQGSAESQTSIGMLHINGEGVPQNYAQAMKWTLLAAKQGSLGARNNLGFIYLNGKGVPRNLRKAYIWFSLAATGGCEPARKILPSVSEQLSFVGRWLARRELKRWRTDDLFKAVEADDFRAVRKLLLEDESLARARREFDNTPLHKARSVAVMAELIKRGAKVNAPNNIYDTPLFYADDKGKVGILVGFGANINARNKNSDTPLHKAATISRMESRMDVVRELVERGADVNARNKHGKTPTDLAWDEDGPLGVVAWLCGHGGKTADELDEE